MGVLIERRRLQFVEKLLAGGTIDLSVQTEVVLMCFNVFLMPFMFYICSSFFSFYVYMFCAVVPYSIHPSIVFS